MLSSLISRSKLTLTDAAIVAVVVLAGVNALVEFWEWLSRAP